MLARPRTVSLLLALVAAGCAPAVAQPVLTDLDAIIERPIEARGGYEAIEAIHSLVYSEGRYSEPGFTGSGRSVMMLMRPYYKLVGHPERDPRFLEGYNGAAWEWFSDPGIVIRTVGPASEALRHYADVEGPFVDYREKGHHVELGEPEVFDGRPAYVLIVTMMDGYRTEWLLDKETFLAVAARHTARVHAFGEPVRSETRIGDHREVAGVLFPHRYAETRVDTGEVVSTMEWGRVEANVEIPVEWFSPPEFERTPLQRFLEHLYVQRTDADALLWTYRSFRRAHPEIDTRRGVEFVGYQILKMGDHEEAVALLEANLADHPDSADSAFELGRSYATAGRVAEARGAFDRALTLDPDHARARQALKGLNEASPGTALAEE